MLALELDVQLRPERSSMLVAKGISNNCLCEKEEYYVVVTEWVMRTLESSKSLEWLFANMRRIAMRDSALRHDTRDNTNDDVGGHERVQRCWCLASTHA